MKTAFASAERTDMKEIDAEYQSLDAMTDRFFFINAMPIMVLVLDRNRQIVYANNVLFEHLKLDSIKDVLGQRLGELLGCIHANGETGGCGTSKNCAVCGAVRTILAGQNGKVSTEECRILTKDNEAFDFVVHCIPFIVNDQRFVLFTLIDISDTKRKKVLENIFFHDILNTASGIQGFAELIPEVTSEEVASFSKIIARLSLQLIDEIQGQRDLLAIEAGEFKVGVDIMKSGDLISDVLQMYRHHSVGENKTIDEAPDSEKITFESDIRLVRRILGNMVKNALEATDAGGSVLVRSRKVFNYIVLSVHNRSFIQPLVQMQIFKRSFSTKGSGRGLGTYSIKLLTEKYLRGRAGFYSSEERGTEFYVILPLTGVSGTAEQMHPDHGVSDN
jgi:nitrogen-specific signal transduction histidine kinase